MSQPGRLLSLNGRWCGDYQYDRASDSNQHQNSVPFILHLQVEWLGSFNGSVQDDPRLGTPEEGRVMGRLSGNKITFTKKMPIYRVAYQGRLIALDRFVREYYRDELRNQLAHPDIFYEGYWEPLIEEFQGKWQIVPERLKFKSGRAVEFPGGTGTWRMASCQGS